MQNNTTKAKNVKSFPTIVAVPLSLSLPHTILSIFVAHQNTRYDNFSGIPDSMTQDGTISP